MPMIDALIAALIHASRAGAWRWRCPNRPSEPSLPQCQSAPKVICRVPRHFAVWTRPPVRSSVSHRSSRYGPGRRPGCATLPLLVEHLLTRPSARPGARGAPRSCTDRQLGHTTLQRSLALLRQNRLGAPASRRPRSTSDRPRRPLPASATSSQRWVNMRWHAGGRVFSAEPISITSASTLACGRCVALCLSGGGIGRSGHLPPH